MEVTEQRIGTDNQRWFRVRFTIEESDIAGWVRADLVEALEDCPG
jgi:hypothetical protein